MAKGSRAYRKTPKKTKSSYSKESLKIYRQTQQKLAEVNKRLEKLSKNGYSGTWASRKLLNRLSGEKTNVIERTQKGGQITGLKLKGKVSNTAMIAIQKASQQFLNSATSTVAGIKSVRERTIESLGVSLSTKKRKISNEEAEFLYEMLNDSDFLDFQQMVGASTMWNLIEDAREKHDSQNRFLKRLEDYAISLEDKDLREKAISLYEKFIED